MGDFNMCVNMPQSTSRFSLMGSHEQDVWAQLFSEVLKVDVWHWLYPDDLGFTFHSTQHMHTWSRLHRVYVIHDESFLPELIHMSAMQDVISYDNFPICLELSNHAIEMYKSLLEKAHLRSNSSLLFHSLFDAYMAQI